MAYLRINNVHLGDTTNATTDGQFLDDVEGLLVEAINLRPESVAGPHFAATRSPDADDCELVTLGWIGTTSGSGTSVHGDVDPGTAVAPGGTTLELLPPNETRSRLQTGDVLRWHFGCLVDEVDFSGNGEDDRYYVEVLITGVDDNGTTTKGAGDSQELGIIAGFSMTSGGVDNAADGAGTNRPMHLQRIHVSGMYIHDGEFTTNGGNVRISAIRVRIYVQDASNEVTVSNATLTAMIVKG